MGIRSRIYRPIRYLRPILTPVPTSEGARCSDAIAVAMHVTAGATSVVLPASRLWPPPPSSLQHAPHPRPESCRDEPECAHSTVVRRWCVADGGWRMADGGWRMDWMAGWLMIDKGRLYNKKMNSLPSDAARGQRASVQQSGLDATFTEPLNHPPPAGRLRPCSPDPRMRMGTSERGGCHLPA